MGIYRARLNHMEAATFQFGLAHEPFVHGLERAGIAFIRVYVDMVPGEHMGRILSMASINAESIQHASLLICTRASFLSYLFLVKERIVANWD
jgi:hypothetical protein